MRFGITKMLTMDCVISTNNNASLISKVSEEIASENAENCRCRQPRHRNFDALPENPREYLHKPYIARK